MKKENDLKKMESEIIKQQWEKDLQREIEAKEQMKDINHKVYKDIAEFNKKEEIIKQRRLEIERKV